MSAQSGEVFVEKGKVFLGQREGLEGVAGSEYGEGGRVGKRGRVKKKRAVLFAKVLSER